MSAASTLTQRKKRSERQHTFSCISQETFFTKQVPSFVLHPLLPILPADVFPGPIKQSLGVMEHAVDQAGRLFVDRDPDMFRCLLQFMRASTGPPQNYIKTNKETLLEECRFFGLDHMMHRITGATSIYDLAPDDRSLKHEESEVYREAQSGGWYPGFLLNVFDENTSPLDPAALGMPLLKPGSTRRPLVTCSSLGQFEERFENLSGGVFHLIKEIPGIVFAGGSIVGGLTQISTSDIDIFLVASLEQAPAILEKIYEIIQAVAGMGKKGLKTLITRSKHAVPRHHVKSRCPKCPV